MALATTMRASEWATEPKQSKHASLKPLQHWSYQADDFAVPSACNIHVRGQHDDDQAQYSRLPPQNCIAKALHMDAQRQHGGNHRLVDCEYVYSTNECLKFHVICLPALNLLEIVY
jgi:hypothetical protein